MTWRQQEMHIPARDPQSPHQLALHLCFVVPVVPVVAVPHDAMGMRRRLLCDQINCNMTGASDDDDGNSDTPIIILLVVTIALILIAAIYVLIFRIRRRLHILEDSSLQFQSKTFYNNGKEDSPQHQFYRRQTLAKLVQTLHTTSDILARGGPKNELNDTDFSEYLDSSTEVTEKCSDDNVLKALDSLFCSLSPMALLNMAARLQMTITTLLKEVQTNGYTESFAKLQEVGINQSCDVARLEHNELKNRYYNILAYDHSRVVLPLVHDDPTTDYINASYVDGYHHPLAYIATQGPVPNSFTSFWRMVWHSDCKVVVMVTREVEGDVQKCHRYWPDETEKELCLGNLFSIVHLNTRSLSYSIERTFEITYGESSRRVTQLCFNSWPDHGVPESANELLMLRTAVKEINGDSTVPVIVHCSAGVGRTGTYIALDRLMDGICNGDTYLDIEGHVRTMREARPSMVQTEEQYLFVYAAVLHAMNLMIKKKQKTDRRKTVAIDDNAEDVQYENVTGKIRDPKVKFEDGDYPTEVRKSMSLCSDGTASSDQVDFVFDESGTEVRIKSCRRVNPLFTVTGHQPFKAHEFEESQPLRIIRGHSVRPDPSFDNPSFDKLDAVYDVEDDVTVNSLDSDDELNAPPPPARPNRPNRTHSEDSLASAPSSPVYPLTPIKACRIASVSEESSPASLLQLSDEAYPKSEDSRPRSNSYASALET